MARVFAVRVLIWLSIPSVAVQVILGMGNYPGIVIFLIGFNLSLMLPMTHNGPAIWGGCVTRRKHRAESRYFSRETVTVQGEYGVNFAFQVECL